MFLSVNAAYLCVHGSFISHVVKRKWKRQMTKVWTVFTWVFQLCQFKQKKISTGTSYSLSHIMKHVKMSSIIFINEPFDTWAVCLLLWYWVIYDCFLCSNMRNEQDVVCLYDQAFTLIPLSFLPPLSLPPSGCGAAHPDRPPPLQWGAAAGQCHSGVSGQRGLPLGLEPGLEGGGQQQLLGGVTQPGGPGERRPLQPEQHPEPPCGPVEEDGLSELWGQSERTEPCHSQPGPWALRRVELQQHLLSGNDALTEILMQLQISSVHTFLQLSQLSAQCLSLHVAF